MSVIPKSSVDFGYPTEAHGKIPSFASIEEEAEFWDTHDTTELDEDWVRVDAHASEHFCETLTLRLSQTDRETLLKVAEREGVEPSALAKRWVVEHLRDDDAKAR